MRRAMMTNRPFGGAPFTVGDPATDRAANTTNDLVVNLDNPAPRAGVITSISVFMFTGATARLFTGSWDGTTFTVTAATGDLALATGSNTLTVSLAIPSGGVVGYYSSGGVIDIDTTGGSILRWTTAAAPTAGATYTAPTTVSAQTASLQGTGS